MGINLLCLFLVIAAGLSETQKDAASYARYLVETEIKASFATVSTKSLFPLASLADFSQSAAKDGNLVFLFADVSQLVNNLKQKPMASLLVTTHNCSVDDYNNLPYDPLACPRVTFSGQFTKLSIPLNQDNVDYQAFIDKHPAASHWIHAHSFNLWTLDIQQIDYVGGYGNLHYIGNIDRNLYFQAKTYLFEKKRY